MARQRRRGAPSPTAVARARRRCDGRAATSWSDQTPSAAVLQAGCGYGCATAAESSRAPAQGVDWQAGPAQARAMSAIIFWSFARTQVPHTTPWPKLPSRPHPSGSLIYCRSGVAHSVRRGTFRCKVNPRGSSNSHANGCNAERAGIWKGARMRGLIRNLRQVAHQRCLASYSTVTDLARLRGWSTSVPRRTATW